MNNACTTHMLIITLDWRDVNACRRVETAASFPLGRGHAHADEGHRSLSADRIVDAVRLLAAMGAVAADPSTPSAVKAGPSIYDTIRKIAAKPPASVARLSASLAAQARAHFEATHDVPRHADRLYAQMVDDGLVTPAEIVAARMDAAAVTEAMLAKLTGVEQRAAPMQALFRTLTQPTLSRLLTDKNLAADLTPAPMPDVLGEPAGLAAAVRHIAGQSRGTLDDLARRFGVPAPKRMGEDELEDFLFEKARDHAALVAEIEALRGAAPRVDNVLAAVEAALERLDLAEAETLLAGVRETAGQALRAPLKAKARIMKAQARVALLRGDAKGAFAILSAAADGFAALDPLEPARRRLDYCGRLRDQGLRYDGPGLALAERMIRRALDDLSEDGQPDLWASGQNKLGVALSDRGVRVGRSAGTRLLGEAAAAYRAALRVRTEAAHPVAWATTQRNLGNALRAQGERTGGADGAGLLGEAVAAYRAALRVRTEAAHPVAWATTQRNLGLALSDRGAWIGGADGAELLGEAVAAYRAALRVRTEAAHPVAWATTQNNLGLALSDRGAWIGGADGAELLGEAVAAYRAALRVRTEAAHPVAWATTQNNLGLALSDRGAWIGGADGAELLGEAVAAYRAALRVRTEAAHPVAWATTQNNLGLALSDRGAWIGGADGAELLGEAVAAYRAALRVRTEAAHPVAWATTQNNLGLALSDRGAWIGGADGAELLGEAVAAYRAALRVRTEAAHPVAWATTQNNLGLALGEQGLRLRGAAGAELLAEAVAAYRAALRVRTEATHPVAWAMTMQYLGLTQEAVAEALPEGARAALGEAAFCLEGAVRGLDREHMPYNHEKASRGLARVRGKLGRPDANELSARRR